jgi:hypothetical protein
MTRITAFTHMPKKMELHPTTTRQRMHLPTGHQTPQYSSAVQD